MEEEFYASIKLKHSGEEIFTKVCASEEEDRTMLVLSNPIVVEEVKFRGKPAGYKMEPWLKTSSQDMFVIDLADVLTMSESSNIEMILYYEDYVSKSNKSSHCELDRKMGYLGNVEDTKKSLEKLFKAS